jgi:hypothetical protein
MARVDTLIHKLKEFGLTAEQVLEVVEIVTAKSATAVRQERFRERQKAKGVTCNVTNNASDLVKSVTSNVTCSSLPFSSPDGSPPSPYSSNIYPPSLTSPQSLSHSRSTGLAEFVRFWEVYPRKTGKGAAEKSWAKAVRLAQPETIINAARDFRWPDDLQFVPHPATWLNQRRWEDEALPEQPIKPPVRKERDLRNIPDNMLTNEQYMRKRIQLKEWR